MNKLQRQQLNNKHTHKHFDGWTNFTPARNNAVVSYSMKLQKTKQQQRDELKLEKDGWK